MKKTGTVIKSNGGSMMCCIRYRRYNDVDVYFPRYDYLAEHVSYGNFKSGNIKCPYERTVYNIGYLGNGPYKVSENGKVTKVYDTWKHMLYRCYDPKFQEKHTTYKKCTVCDEWHNFQNFAEWYENNYYEIEGQIMNLDKDILIKKNNVYSPETCVFVPHDINSLFTKSDATRGDLPVGVHYDKQNKKYSAQCNIMGLKKFIGRYNTLEEAFQAYKAFKEAHIKQVADKYIDLIPQELYNAMINYEVKNDD